MPRRAEEPRPHRVAVPVTEAQRRALGVAAAERLMSVAELCRLILDYGLEHLEQIDQGERP